MVPYIAMKTKMRSIKRTPIGKYSRAKVRSAIAAVHVLEIVPEGKWEVRTLGEKGYSKVFDSKKPAIEHAFSVEHGGTVILHQRNPRKVVSVRSSKSGDRIAFKESKLR